MKTIQLVLNILLLSNRVYNPLQSISESNVNGDLLSIRNYLDNYFE